MTMKTGFGFGRFSLETNTFCKLSFRRKQTELMCVELILYVPLQKTNIYGKYCTILHFLVSRK